MLANLVISSVGAFTVKVFNRGTGTQVGSTITATPVGSSVTRWTINLGSLADGQFDLEHGDGYGSWALVVTSGVAAVYESWESYSPLGGSGQYSVVSTIRDSVTSSLLQGALVTIERSSGNIYWAFTNDLGVAKFLLDPATYSINVSMSGYASVIGQSAVVSGPTSVNVVLDEISFLPPVVSGLCTVTFAVTDAGTPVVGALIHVELEEPNPRIPNFLVSRVTHDAVTDSEGLATLTMIQRIQFAGDGVYRVKVSDANGKKLHDRRVTVPSVSTINAANLTDA